MTPNNFILFFLAKEGTTPLMRLLNNFERISVVHQTNNRGWEPFDKEKCGTMPLRNLKQCLNLIYNQPPPDMLRLNQIYMKTATRPLETFDKNGAVGFKMRFTPPDSIEPYVINRIPLLRTYLVPKYHDRLYRNFKKLMFGILKQHNVVVFVAVRQDVFRWGLSIYHGDGTGRPGHLQFKLAEAEIQKADISKIEVDCERLEKIISDCERHLQNKRNLMEELNGYGIRTHPLLYEDFCNDKMSFFTEFLTRIEMPVSKDEIKSVLRRGTQFVKVHSDDISDFVTNHEEVLAEFGNRYLAWD